MTRLLGLVPVLRRTGSFALAAALLVAGACRSSSEPIGFTPGRPERAQEPLQRSRTPEGSDAHHPEAPELARPATALPPGADRGIFDDLSERVQTRLPAWLSDSPVHLVRAPSADTSDGPRYYRVVGGVPIALSQEPGRILDARFADGDGDGIPDALDILRGAKKTVLDAAHYKSSYRELAYPLGDVPRDEGVCSDVIVRALRNAGFDLQQLVHEDLRRHPERYPSVDKPDRNIDHRRVRVLLPWFERHFQALPTTGHDTEQPLLPGDVVFFDTLRGPEPDHVGIVSDELAPSGLPLVINSWTDGHRTAAMDLLASIRVTHRFRVPTAVLEVNSNERGLDGVLERQGLTLADDVRQVLLVTSVSWGHSAGNLRRFTRGDTAAPWTEVAPAIPVRLGRTGLKRGRGVHAPSLPAGLPDKREGDGSGPAGVFELGAAFGPEGNRPAGSAWPWRTVRPGDVWVDDPGSRSYNRWQRRETEGFRSAEDLTMYGLGLIVEHNTRPVAPGFGSAIFLHDAELDRPTAGCTSMRRDALADLLRWLLPSANPKLVQVADHVYP